MKQHDATEDALYTTAVAGLATHRPDARPCRDLSGRGEDGFFYVRDDQGGIIQTFRVLDGVNGQVALSPIGNDGRHKKP